MVKEKKNVQDATTTEKPVAVEHSTCDDELRAFLEEIKNHDGVVGYILRNLASASIDLKDPAKIIDYAMLSSSAFDIGKELSNIFDLGNVENIVVNGKKVMMLCMLAKENKISFFMTADANMEEILKKCARISGTV